MITLSSAEFARFGIAARDIDKTILASLRKQLKALMQVGVEAVQKAVLQDPPDDQPGSVGSRAAIAAGTRGQVTFGKRGGSVRIVSTNSRLDSDHKGFVGAYETRGLRHPVFGSNDNQVAQPTRPYFGASILEVLPDRGQKAMAEVIDDAVRALGGHGK